jgi:fructosamine-3-kinase
MPLQENDISWQLLRRIVHDWAGTAAELTEVKPLVGGVVNTTLALGLKDRQKAVLKITPHRVTRAYEEEAYQLNLLREQGLPTPEVYISKVGTLDEPFSYLLMQFVDGVNLVEAKRACPAEQYDHLQGHLADLVLGMHEHTSSHYRRVGDGGGKNSEHASWPAFYREVYDPIWHELERLPVLPVKARKQIAKLHGRLEQFLVHSDRPRLVHWDLWSQNLLAKCDEHGRWWISGVLDPNCKFAHAEAEIAYMDLFHTITPAFLRAYQQVHRLPDAYHRLRKPIYQLYSMLNHVRLFGQEYVSQALMALEKTSAIV